MNIIKVEIKRNFKSLLMWSIVSSLIVILFMSIYPSMKNSAMMDIVNTKMDTLPKSMLEIFNINEMANFADIGEYFAYSFQYILMVSAIYGGILGANSLISEESDGTIEFLYSKPVSRSKIASMKIISNIISFFIFSMIISISSVICILLFIPDGVDKLETLIDVKLVLIAFFLLGVFFMSVGFLISTVIKSAKSATPIALGLFFGTYFVGILSKLNDNVEFLKYVSPYDNLIPAQIMKNGFNEGYLLAMIGIIAVCIGMTLVVYKRKDYRI